MPGAASAADARTAVRMGSLAVVGRFPARAASPTLWPAVRSVPSEWGELRGAPGYLPTDHPERAGGDGTNAVPVRAGGDHDGGAGREDRAGPDRRRHGRDEALRRRGGRPRMTDVAAPSPWSSTTPTTVSRRPSTVTCLKKARHPSAAESEPVLPS